MEFYTCGCFLDYQNYLTHCRGGFFVKADRHKKQKEGKTFNLTFFKTCYLCSFSLLKVKTFDADEVHCKLRQKFVFYSGDSTISRPKGYAETCIETLKTYNGEPDKISSVCCYRCLKILSHNILDELYTV